MKPGKGYRICTIMFCSGYILYTLLLLLFRVLCVFSSTALTVFLFLSAPLGSDEMTLRYALSGITIFPVVVSLIYFLCIGEFREAISKAELLLLLIPAGFGLLGILHPIFILPLYILTPILYFCLACLHLEALREKKDADE